MEKLDRGLDRTLILVAAPAGYGKSTLAAEWLETCARPSAWLSLDEGDSDLMVFLNYFIAAVQSVLPEACQEISALLHAPDRPSQFALASTLINDLDRIGQPFIVALDDYHLIHDMAVHNLMDDLLHHAPRTLHLVLISRINPPLNLRRLRARGQLTEIRVEDLRFTTDEIGAFMQKTWGASFDEAEIARLQEKTEGWAAGLRLCFLSLKGPDELVTLADRFPGKGLVTDYLFHEVFINQPEAMQEYLLSTSILDRFSASLCEYLHGAGAESGSMSGQAFIDWLTQADIFVISLDDEREWFRYHHLFQEVLRRQLAKTYDDEGIARLHDRASDWFARNGMIDEAIHHGLAAGDVVQAAELIEQNMDEILNTDRWPILERWLAYLSDEIIQQRPKLLLARLWIMHFQYNISAIPLQLKQMDAVLGEEPVDSAMAGEREFFRGEPRFWRGEIEQSIHHFEQALALLPPENKLARGAAEIFLMTAYQVIGQTERAVAKGQALLKGESEDDAYKGRLLGALIFVHLLSGRSAEAHRVADRLMAMAKRMNAPFFIGWAAYLLGYIHFGWNDLETAITHFTLAADNRFFLNQNLSIDNYIGLALSYQAIGQRERVDEIIGQLLECVQTPQNPVSALLLRSTQARLAILQGDMEKMIHWLRTVDFSVDLGMMFVTIESPRITHGRLLTAWGTNASLQKAVAILQDRLQWTRSTHNVRQQMEILPILAVAYQRQGRPRKATHTLEQALTLAEPDGWIRPFLEFGPDMGELLNGIDGACSVRDFRDQIVAALSTSQAGSLFQIQAQLPEPLTNRELEVLALLAQRRSNKEIAAALVISPTTVKRHASNIYQKLQVNGRRQAATKAISLGLILS
jgi:LuxR family maltose regulon positive regulatory protein